MHLELFASIDPDWYHIWQQATLTVTAAIALLGFFRGLEHRKDANFRDLARSLADPQSPVLRASAAAQLPAYASYRRFFLFGRPYRRAALMLALSALKRKEEEKQVRQQLANSLRQLLPRMVPAEGGLFDLIEAQLHDLILHHFPFRHCDLTGALLRDSDLGGATFAGAKLWKAQLQGSKCTDTDFSNAQLWDAQFDRCLLNNAIILTHHVNVNTTFTDAAFHKTTVSQKVADLCKLEGRNGIVVDAGDTTKPAIV